MAELTFDPQTIADALRRAVETYEPSVEREEVGRVHEAGAGIAVVLGLPRAMANELLEFPGGKLGLASNLDEDRIGCVILDEEFADIEEGDPVKRTGRILSAPVGNALLGRVVDPLGRPLDGKGPVASDATRPLEVQAPSVVSRQPVKEPLQTGIKSIDAMTPIGRGQRELIIGDRQTGKTAIVVDTIINQRELWGTDRQVKCIYVAVGQKGSTVREVVEALTERGAMDYTVVVNAPAAYPGDVFYLHSLLLERCAKLSDELGGGSLTGLPIVETKGNDISAYIPTNVISITDGQIYLEPDLFYAGVRPAINVGISVSRVGGNAQIRGMKKVAGTLRIDLAQFRALEAFALFASDLDKTSRAQLDRGNRMFELLKQGQYEPMPIEQQVIALWSGTNGFLDPISIPDVRRFERELLEFMEANHPEIGQHIREQGDLPEEVEGQLRDAVTAFARRFRTSGGKPALRDEQVEPMDEDEEGQEAVRAYRRDTPDELAEEAGPAGQGASSGTP